jgi:hypothetical protein
MNEVDIKSAKLGHPFTFREGQSQAVGRESVPPPASRLLGGGLWRSRSKSPISLMGAFIAFAETQHS